MTISQKRCNQGNQAPRYITSGICQGEAAHCIIFASHIFNDISHSITAQLTHGGLETLQKGGGMDLMTLVLGVSAQNTLVRPNDTKTTTKVIRNLFC